MILYIHVSPVPAYNVFLLAVIAWVATAPLPSPSLTPCTVYIIIQYYPYMILSSLITHYTRGRTKIEMYAKVVYVWYIYLSQKSGVTSPV